MVDPNTTVKLRENVNKKWLVDAKLYGIIPTRLCIKININNVYINGKYIWLLLYPIWLNIIPFIVVYIDSLATDHLLFIIFFKNNENIFIDTTIVIPMNRYSPIFVKDILLYSKMDTTINCTISNWDKGVAV